MQAPQTGVEVSVTSKSEGVHSQLIAEPVERRSRPSHVVALAEFVFVCNRIHSRIEAVNIGPHAR